MPERACKEHFTQIKWKSAITALWTYTGEPLKVKGKGAVKVDHNGRSKTLPLYVVDNKNKDLPTLLGSGWIAKLQLDWKTVYVIGEEMKVKLQ